MRTTLTINDELLREAELAAQQSPMSTDSTCTPPAPFIVNLRAHPDAPAAFP